jgi:hypothetical protein
MKKLITLFIIVISLTCFSQVKISNAKFDGKKILEKSCNKLEEISIWTVTEDSISCDMYSLSGEHLAKMFWYVNDSFKVRKDKVYDVTNLYGQSYILSFSKNRNSVTISDYDVTELSIIEGEGLNINGLNN